MWCKSILAEMEELKEYEISFEEGKSFEFVYCVSYRHPNLPERILARGYWNDQGLWFVDGIWNEH